MSCPHAPSRVSVNGYYTCPLCFELIEHPWYVDRYPLKRTQVESGIERMAREHDSDWLAQAGVQRP